jgi:hypothetical protein
MSIASGPNAQYNIKIMVLHNGPTSVQHQNNLLSIHTHGPTAYKVASIHYEWTHCI